ncbi:MAG: hypothetical protein HC831_08035 [Chloroflexia bacterium]|nr:hypothetical protein [Chloroflexia bacterium]
MKKIVAILLLFFCIMGVSIAQNSSRNIDSLSYLKKERKVLKKKIKKLDNLIFISGSYLKVYKDPFTHAKIIRIVNKEMAEDLIRVEPKVIFYPNDSINIEISVIFRTRNIEAYCDILKIKGQSIFEFSNVGYVSESININHSYHLGYGATIGNNINLIRNIFTIKSAPYEILEDLANAPNVIVHINDTFPNQILDESDHRRIKALYDYVSGKEELLELKAKLELINKQLEIYQQKSN